MSSKKEHYLTAPFTPQKAEIALPSIADQLRWKPTLKDNQKFIIDTERVGYVAGRITNHNTSAAENNRHVEKVEYLFEQDGFEPIDYRKIIGKRSAIIALYHSQEKTPERPGISFHTLLTIDKSSPYDRNAQMNITYYSREDLKEQHGEESTTDEDALFPISQALVIARYKGNLLESITMGNKIAPGMQNRPSIFEVSRLITDDQEEEFTLRDFGEYAPTFQKGVTSYMYTTTIGEQDVSLAVPFLYNGIPCEKYFQAPLVINRKAMEKQAFAQSYPVLNSHSIYSPWTTLKNTLPTKLTYSYSQLRKVEEDTVLMLRNLPLPKNETAVEQAPKESTLRYFVTKDHWRKSGKDFLQTTTHIPLPVEEITPDLDTHIHTDPFKAEPQRMLILYNPAQHYLPNTDNLVKLENKKDEEK